MEKDSAWGYILWGVGLAILIVGVELWITWDVWF